MASQSNVPETKTPEIQETAKPYKAVVIGGTGAVGSSLVKELLASPSCSQVTSLVRKETDVFASVPGKEKLHQRVVNLDTLHEDQETKQAIQDHEIAFCTLGVGKPTAVSREEFIKVEHTYTGNFASLCKSAGVRHVSYLGSTGVSADSSIFYLRSKVQSENLFVDQKFDRVSLFRPSLLATPEARYGARDKFIQWAFPKISWMLPGRLHEISVSDLGRVMRINAERHREKSGVEYLEYPQFAQLLRSEAPAQPASRKCF